jgi:hypothetical protein
MGDPISRAISEPFSFDSETFHEMDVNSDEIQPGKQGF